MRQVSAAFAALAISLILTTPSMAAAEIQLVRVASGLSSPVFVTNAHDGTNRLFIVEQGGVIKVLQPNSALPTTFINISSKLSAGGERGLLGLAFHPDYPSNPHFYVNYTRRSDGATVIAQYQVSAGDTNVANSTGTVLLVIPHPNANHYAGMMDFGADGFLYIATGDGDSSLDSDNSAQDKNQLLGKILRIDVDHPNGAMPYSSPAANPFFGSAVAGADEIYAYGFRNPWRFSFDRGSCNLSNQCDLYVADVGQASREEVDIVTPGNYGWRVWEGTSCKDLEPGCTGTGYTFPVIEYNHTPGHCSSITGGYVYRGTQGNLPVGSYVYGDYCTGEIFLVENNSSSVLLDTTLAISSFGEDEAGEVYVVNLNGAIDQIARSACTYTIDSTSADFGAGGGPGTVNVTAQAGCPWTAISNDSWIKVTDSRGSGGTTTVHYSVDAKRKSRTGTITIAGQTFTVTQSR